MRKYGVHCGEKQLFHLVGELSHNSHSCINKELYITIRTVLWDCRDSASCNRDHHLDLKWHYTERFPDKQMSLVTFYWTEVKGFSHHSHTVQLWLHKLSTLSLKWWKNTKSTVLPVLFPFSCLFNLRKQTDFCHCTSYLLQSCENLVRNYSSFSLSRLSSSPCFTLRF